MATNKYINHTSANNDQSLQEQLIIESIQIHGVDIYYVPRDGNEDAAIDKIYGENSTSSFTKAYEIEAYIKDAGAWTENSDYLSKFNLQMTEKNTLVISMKRFRSITGLDRLYEGDILYVQGFSDSLYVVTHVVHDSNLWSLGKLNYWEVQFDLLNYSNQRLRTGIAAIDKFEAQNTAANAIYLQTITTTTNGTTTVNGSGNFVINEIVYQGSTFGTKTAYGTVVSWDKTTKKLVVRDKIGDFLTTGGNVKGNTSGATYPLLSYDEKELPNEPISNNKDINDMAASIVNWTASNPFSEN